MVAPAFSSSVALSNRPTRGANAVCNRRPVRACASKVSDSEWQERLSPAEYVVLRNGRTEWPWSSELNGEKRDGAYHCVACNAQLFESDTKFNSGTGWPSFWAPVEGAIKLKEGLFDRLVGQREVSCASCGGHLGHVFRDGPKPTGERFCINGITLRFAPKIEGGGDE